MRDSRVARSPTRSGLPTFQKKVLPAHTRRGRAMGGMKSSPWAWPSWRVCSGRNSGRKYSQCHNGGTGVPSVASAGAWPSVAASAFTGKAVMSSVTRRVRPIQVAKSCDECFGAHSSLGFAARCMAAVCAHTDALSRRVF